MENENQEQDNAAAQEINRRRREKNIMNSFAQLGEWLDEISDAIKDALHARMGDLIDQERGGRRHEDSSGSVSDKWFVVAQISNEADGVRTRISFLLGEKTRRTARLIEYTDAKSLALMAVEPGRWFEAEFGFLGSVYPTRTRLIDMPSTAAVDIYSGEWIPRSNNPLVMFCGELAEEPVAEVFFMKPQRK